MLAVTTRIKLKSGRFLPQMLIARRSVRQQLRRTRGLVRWADAIASPSEFYTLTLWSGKKAVFDFMNSDAHRRMMWQFSQWSDEFWSMRWGATDREIGAWKAFRIAESANPAYPWPAQSPIPEIALGARPGAGRVNPASSSVAAVTAYLNANGLTALRQLSLVRGWFHDKRKTERDLLRWAIGATEARQFLIVSLWRADAAERMKTLASYLPDAWLIEWQPGDYEIGHWDGLRVRQFAGSPARSTFVNRMDSSRIS